MLTPAWTPMVRHAQQMAAWRTRARFVAIAAGRGSGKTMLARRRAVRFLPLIKDWPRPMYAYCLPTYKQARRVAWQEIKALVPGEWLKKPPNESEMLIETVFGSQLYVVGLDKPQRIEGDQWDGIVVDESCDQRPGSFELSIMPALTHKEGWCWRIGVPKRTGIGSASFKRFCGMTPTGEGPVADESYGWPSADILTPKQLKYFRENLAPADFSEQFEASWEKVGGLIFYAFDETEGQNVDSKLQYDPDKPILVGSDFNVDPMCWTISQQPSPSRLDVIDEMFIRNTNTRQTLDELHRRYPGHRAGWDFFGDPAGRARHTSASMSDYLTIKNDERFVRARCWYPKAAPSQVDRFAACNAMFLNADGERRCKVHPRCKNLIRDLGGRAYKEGTSEPNDKKAGKDVGHSSDSLGYKIHKMFPVRRILRPGSGAGVTSLVR